MLARVDGRWVEVYMAVRRPLETKVQCVLVCVCLTAMPGLAPQVDRSQIVDPAAVDPSKGHQDRLQLYSKHIRDPQARPEERRNWAEALLAEWFRAPSDDARKLIVELLTKDTESQSAVCEAIANGSVGHGDRLDAGFVPPLFVLLGSDNAEVRSAAAQALAEFPGEGVAAGLGAAAGQADLPMTKRLAAIDSLAVNIYRRDVIAELIRLLAADSPEIRQRAFAALEPAAREPIGPDPQKWAQWWAEKQRLTDQEWVVDQLRMYRERDRRIKSAWQAFQEDSKRQQADLSTKLRDFQRELFRTVAGEQRDAKLVEWLGDPHEEVKLTPLGIIKARIADEGKRPEGDVLAMLLKLLKTGSPVIRREVLAIVQNLGDPAVVEAVLAQLEAEKDPATRVAILRALGKLDSPDGVPVLVREIASPDSRPEGVREAALALAQIAENGNATAQVQAAVAPLMNRYQAAAADDMSMRAGLLTAMVGVGDPIFAPCFLEAAELPDAAVLRAAIRGLRAIGDTSKLPLLRRHTQHGDPLVRLAAIEAVGQLGREEADLESMLPRLNPALELNEPAREAAWRGFRQLLADKPVRDRIAAAALLRDVPDREIAYLDELARALPATEGNAAEREAVLERLGLLLAAAGKHDDAVPHLRELYGVRSARGDATTLDWGLQLLDTLLQARNYSEAANLIRQLASEANGEAPKRVVRTVAQYIESPEMVADPERTRLLLEELKTLPVGTLGDEWTKLLTRAADRLSASNRASANKAVP